MQAVQREIDVKIQSVARFFMEASLFHRDFIGLLPSHLTAGSLMLARYVCNQASRQESKEAIQAAQVIDTFMMNNLSELSEILMKKYSFAHFASASTVVKDWYTNMIGSNAKMAATATGLLPAQSVSVQHLAQHDKANSKGAAGSSQTTTSSFSTPQRRGDEDEEMSIRSSCTTPSSMISTPSRMSGNGEEEEEDEEEYDDDELEEDEDADMPVTPLSLNSLHDPLINASSGSSHAKENGKLHPTKNSSLQVKAIRPVLTISQRDNKMNTN
jgi:hypothetical protein